jgi:hypothetical protein
VNHNFYIFQSLNQDISLRNSPRIMERIYELYLTCDLQCNSCNNPLTMHIQSMDLGNQYNLVYLHFNTILYYMSVNSCLYHLVCICLIIKKNQVTQYQYFKKAKTLKYIDSNFILRSKDFSIHLSKQNSLIVKDERIYLG